MNATLTSWLQDASDGWADWMWHISWQLFVLVAVLTVVTWALRGQSARLRHALWLLVLVRLVLPPATAFPTGYGWWIGPLVTGNFLVTAPNRSLATAASNAGKSDSSQAGSSLPVLSWSMILFLLWSGVLAVRLGMLLMAWAQVRSWVARDPRIVDPVLLQMLREVQQKVGWQGRIELRNSEACATPLVLGWWHPVVLLPRTILERLSPAELETVMVHELMHVKRGDGWIRAVQAILESFYFFHPAVWWSSSQLRKLREDACDEATVATLGKRKAYGSALVKAAEILGYMPPPLALGILDSNHPITLPAGNERQWKYDSGISIEQKNENDRGPFGAFGRFGPFGPQNDDKKTQSGQEEADYAIQSQDENKIVVKKSYRLKTPAVRDEPALEITGTGTWTFHRKDHMPDALDFQQKLLITDDNTQITVPITIAYHRLSAESIAKMDQEAQQRLKDAEKKAAEDKEKAETPLTPDEKKTSLAAIASRDPKKIDDTLKFLRGKSPKDPDSEMAAAIESLLRNSNTKIRDDAKATLLKWSPDFARKHKLNEAYAAHMPVESTDREVNSTTPLYVGQILQFQEHGTFWFAGEVLELADDGKVKVRGRGIAKQEHVLPRRNLQLAPDEVDQPKKLASVPATATASSSSTDMRTWIDATGEHRIEAVFLGLADGKVKLKKADGKEIAVPLDKLSKADQKHVQELQTAKKSANPFE